MKEVRGTVSLLRVRDEQDVDKPTNQATLTPLKKKGLVRLPAALISELFFHCYLSLFSLDLLAPHLFSLHLASISSLVT